MAQASTLGVIFRVIVLLAFLASLSGLAACTHKLVAHSGETTVNVFPTKDDFDKLMSMKSRGGAEGLVAGLGENFMVRKVAQNTPVKIISSDSEGAQIQVLEGPNAGLRGYVSKDNLD
jgi:hypothetical protein